LKNSTTLKYVPEIDGLRAIAVLAVVIYHMNLSPLLKGGFIGVDIFFVISGYVISKSLYNGQALGLLSYISNFYTRRMKRIIPALVTCLVVTMIASILFIPASWLDDLIGKTGLSAFLGYSNFTLALNNNQYFSVVEEYNPFLHTWSLAVEEQFYLLFPLLFYVWLNFRGKESVTGFIARVILPFLCIISFCFAIWETSVNHNRAFYLLPSRFWELAVGALLFQFHSKNFYVFKSQKMLSGLMLTGIMMIVSGFIFTDPWAFPFPWALVPVTATTLILNGIAGTIEKPSFLSKFLSSLPMKYIGKISYSLYLWHWPAAVLLRWTVGFNTYWLMFIYLAASFGLATLSYHFIETPIRKGAFLLKQQNWKIITSGIVVIVVVFLAAQLIAGAKQSLCLSVTKDSYIWQSGRYERDKPKQPINLDPHIAGRRIFALGDSHTAAYRTMLNIVSGQLGIEVSEYEAGGCAVAGLLKPMSQLENCEQFYQDSLSEIKRLAKPGDIVFLASMRMPELSNRFEIVDIESVLTEFNSSESLKDRQLALEEANQIIKEFETLELYVLIEAPLPVIKVPLYRCSDWFNKMNPIASPGTTISRDVLLGIRQPVMDSLSILQERHPNLYVWDPFYVLCDQEEFSAYDDNGLPIFYDGDHLSAHGNRMLVPSFLAKLLTIWDD
jgi:peptidoglycan/LPS O-acetylase OafA/YrhL